MNKPYVYKITHKETNQFYIGYRSANKLPAIQDIGVKYSTSSKAVKLIGFNNFNIEIIAEFLDRNSAYDFEQILIERNISNPLCLNKSFTKFGKLRRITYAHTEETKNLLSLLKKGKSIPCMQGIEISEERRSLLRKPKSNTKNMKKPKTKEHAENISKAKKGVPGKKGRVVSEETRNKHRQHKHTQETLEKMSKSRSGIPVSEETKEKLRKYVTCFNIISKCIVTIDKKLFDELRGTQYVGTNSNLRKVIESNL